MFKILMLVVVMVAGLIIGPDLAGNQGYVLISLGDKTLEMSLTTLLVIVFTLLILLFLVELIVRGSISFSSKTTNWLLGRKNKRALENTHDGLLKLLEGDWKQAEKLVVKGASHSDAPLLNYLAAAEAAQNRGDVENRDRYLQQAADFSHDNIVTSLTRAKLQYRQGQYEEAMASLQALVEANPRNVIVLSLLKDTYIKLQDWQALLRLLPSLKRNKAVTDEEADALELEAEAGLLKHIAKQKGSEGLLSHWDSLSRTSRQQTPLIVCLVELLIKLKADDQAFIVLRDSIKQPPEDQLIELMLRLNLSDYHPMILLLENLLKSNEDNATIHNALGQLFFRNSQWQDARNYFEKAIEIESNVTNYAWLVDTLEKLDDGEAANTLSRQALKQALSTQGSKQKISTTEVVIS